MNSIQNNQITAKKTAKQMFLLGLPYLLTFFALACFAFCASVLIRQATEKSFWNALFNAPELTDETDGEIAATPLTGDVHPVSDLPIMVWGDRFATLSVDELPDASINGAPVFVGDSNDILKKGVGKYYGSRFCGEGGKIVLSAHCNKAFYCLEDMQVGYTVRMHTVYGEYVYRVKEIFIFERTDSYVVVDESKDEELLLYTCYPRGITYRRQRIGIRCEKVSGADFR